MGRVKGNQTILATATSNSASLKTTVPLHIVQQFGLKPKDRFAWKMEIDGDKLRIVIIPVHGE